MASPWASSVAAEDPPAVTEELRERAVGVLRGPLTTGPPEAVTLAAKFLYLLDYPQYVAESLADHLEAIQDKPHHRIDLWQAMALAPVREEKRKIWIDKIRAIAADADAPDRIEAARALGELGYKVRKEGDDQLEKDATTGKGPLAAYLRWVLVNSGQEHAEGQLAELLGSDDPTTRAATAYALRHLPNPSAKTREKLAAVVLAEPKDSPARVDLVAAAAVVLRADCRVPLLAQLSAYVTTGGALDRYKACEALAPISTGNDLPLLVGLLGDDGPRIRLAAAYAILRTGRRVTFRMSGVDWAVIALYALGMLAVGVYYSRRAKNTEEYLLGGRQMNALSLGLSLFATMLSTITYLAVPGEVIKYGPALMLGKVAAYPLVMLVVGWGLIPFIMKMRVTSAYEILETRLGLGVRMLGSTFFLALRLMWMGVIVFATSDKVLVPLLDLDSSATPYICALLGLITVTYTSMGGLRAVVFTDVVQTFILFGGAILTLVLITTYFGGVGGVGGWWPAHWPSHWPDMKWGYDSDPDVRTFAGALIATFVWFVCTSGSDQMAIQRYLANRDVKAARRTVISQMVASALAALFLTAVGLALLAYFRANPFLIPDGQRLLGDADKLFPRFILSGLPVGLTGLVTAGLLAAAMSSLSSGVNSSCSVITVDFIDRFRRRTLSEADHVRMAKYVSVLVGIVVVLLSSFVGMVQGNLLAVAFKVCNLLTAPLFGLFFMAMFVRWATGPGTIVGAIFGLAAVVAVNYWEEMTGAKGISFLWAMPLGLLVQIAVGMVASLVPVGHRGPPSE